MVLQEFMNYLHLTNTLIGDPIISLPIPKKPNLRIKNEDIKLISLEPTDLEDSSKINVIFQNLGLSTSEQLELLVLHSYNNITDSNLINVRMPKFSKSIKLSIATKNEAGNHLIKLILDPKNKIDEIYENDNTVEFIFYVSSSTIRTLLNNQIFNGLEERIQFLNPTAITSNEEIIVEKSDDQEFTNSFSETILMDSLVTKLSISDLTHNKRYWFRSKLNGTSNYSSPQSFYKSKEKYLISDSLSFENIDSKTLFSKENSIRIDSTKIKFELVSAGFSDGKTALILRDNQNMIPENTLRGHHICIFDESSFELLDHKVFDILGGGSAKANEYIAFLDTISTEYLVMFAIMDEGGINLSTDLKSKIKSFGSVLIDSVGFRSSWVFIGKKGSTPGRLPEAFSNEGEGLVRVDSTISFLTDAGNLTINKYWPIFKLEKYSYS